MIDGKSTEDAPGQICAQYGLMDHIDLGRSAPSEREKRVVCVSLCFTPPFWFLVTQPIVRTGEA